MDFINRLLVVMMLSVAAGAGISEPNQLFSGRMQFAFTPTARLHGATVAHTATSLPNGDVLVLGGYGKLFGRVPIASSMGRIFDHQKHSWRVLSGTLHYGRLIHAALALPDGKVLIVGGLGQDNKHLRSVEIFDPQNEQFELVGHMNSSHRHPRLNLLPGSKVLITGLAKQAEIIEPDPNHPSGYIIRPTRGQSAYGHGDHAAINLADGRVLLAGGRMTSLEMFDYESETFTSSQARLSMVLDDQAGCLLYDGTVLLAGGQEIYSNRSVRETWIYDPNTDSLCSGPMLNATSKGKIQPGAADMAAVDLYPCDKELAGRYILLCGGEYDPGPGEEPDIVLDSAMIYDAVRRRLIDVGPMRYGHDDFAAVTLPQVEGGAEVLIIGGYGPNDTFQSHCEIFFFRMAMVAELANEKR